jgi:alkylation response protein AidB-like acyl-CoA dehydrogenase
MVEWQPCLTFISSKRVSAVDLDFNEEQVMLRDTARGICEELSPSAVVRAMEQDVAGYSAPFWGQLSELGITSLGIPEAHGGMAWGALEMAIVYEEFGRSLAPSPHWASCVLSAKVLELAGTDAQQSVLLPGIASGETIVVPAWLEPKNGFGPEGVQMRAVKQGDGYVLNGTKLMVQFAGHANRLLVLARVGEGVADVIGLLVDPTATGVKLTRERNHADDALYQVDFSNVAVAAADVLGAKNFWNAWDEAMTRSIVALAAQAIGAAEAIHAMATEYSKQRVQFGKPIGSFQAIAHYLADMIVKIEGAKVLVYQAAWAIDNNKPYAKLAAQAKLQACNVFREASAIGVQIHGGFGFTSEGDPQLYFRRAKHWQMTHWDSTYLEKRIAALILDAA